FLAEERPPIILGSSANNKAITNILDSFASVTPSEEYRTGLNERWLPDLTVLGHYLAANNAEKLDQARNAGYWVTNAGKTGADAYNEYCEQHPLELCTEYLLKKFKEYKKETDLLDLKDCYNQIKVNVVGLVSKIDRVLLAISKVRAIIEQFHFGSVPIVTLPVVINNYIEIIRERRVFIESLWAQEHLRITKPGIFLRIIDRIRFGNVQVRRARIQSALIQRSEFSGFLTETDFYRLSESLWKQREADFQQEVTLIHVLNDNTLHFEALEPYISDIQKDVLASSPKWIELIQEKLDIRERHDAFWWALHGLECKWLMQRDDEAYRKLNLGESQSVQRWKQRAFLTPVFVSTFYSLPKFFCYSKKTPQDTWINPPLSELLDLLVIDEAGQVAPEIGVPAFGLAKKAVVVGDVHQLEPIWNIVCESIDFSNCKRAEILSATQVYEGFARSNRSSVNGSLMILAQDASAFIYPPDWNEAGALLVEHRRCSPPIIEYCNQFVYKSLLSIKTTLKKTELPALGYCHVGGESRKHHTSQSNPVEARAIAAWL
ncbi:MAG: ATP-binding protein, partial [Kosmotogaceae bacterium]|nr:ATP-binding protein [Kosmotogaceae bacterium]